MENNSISRRSFIKKTVATTSSALVTTSIMGEIYPGSVLGANDRIQMGFIGVGNRGSLLLNLFLKESNCRIAGLCDVYEPYLLRDISKVDPRILQQIKGSVPRMNETLPSGIIRCGDYRKLLESKDIDAVCIGTPDHWHAIQAIDAMNAGKDVYVEKPLTLTIHEGRMMVRAQQKTGRVAAVGLNRRGNGVYRKLVKEVLPSGKLGKISVASAFRINNQAPDGIGRMKGENPPAGMDWDRWIGPQKERPFQYNIAPYTFRWWSDYSSQMGNWGVHFMDVIRWMLGEKAPVAVTAVGGNYMIDDDRTIPDTMQVTFEFASGVIGTFCIYEASSGNLFDFGEVQLRGSGGTLNVDEGGYKIVPARAGQFQTWKTAGVAEEFYWKDIADLGDGSNSNSTQVLVRDFLQCIRSRNTPLCTLEEGHRSTSFAHLANIALKMKKRLEWNAETEQFTNCNEANPLLHYTYRSPWKLNI
ncbi:MAG: Gfo/Idh/MocA family oxidoreductase [Tannerellaceae bacterium]|jgi:predicted dehydrogenase|nr:Gfo/Idh/MocA family oxidoreductase [Tannerellaceae bacterium]